MKILIVEDEPLAAERLQKLLQEIDRHVEVVAIADSIKSTVAWLNQNDPPDIILMDIELADGQSFEIFGQVTIKSSVIFTTSYDEYALRAFKVNSIDYLLKPVKKEDIKKSLEKYEALRKQFARPTPSVDIGSLLAELKQLHNKTTRNRFLVKMGQRLVSIETSEIAYFYADGRLSYFKTWNNQKYVVDYTIDQLEQMLDSDDYYRVNRAFIVRVKAVAQIHMYFNGKLKLELNPSTEKEVLVSKERAKEFKEWMGK